MKRHFPLITLAALALLGLLAARLPAQTVPAYTFVDLDTLRGNYTIVTGINNAGQICGYGYFEPTNSRAFRITPLDTDNDTLPDTWAVTDGNGNNSLMEVLPLFSNYHYSEAQGINASGAVCGQALGEGYTLPQDAIYWSPTGAAQTIIGSVWAWAINDAGSMVGEGNTKKFSGPTLWRLVNGSFVGTSLGIPGGQARAVNNLDQVAGTDGNLGVPYIWLPSPAYGLPAGKTSLGTLGGTFGISYAINNSGHVVGYAVDAASTYRACLWLPPNDTTGFGTPGMMNDLTTGDWTASIALALNNPAAGQPLLITGTAWNPMGQLRAFLWDSAGREMRDLHCLTVNPPQEGMNEGRGVNVGGMIVGNYTRTLADGSTHDRPFLLLPNATLPDVATVPAAVTGLSVAGLTANQVSLSWTDNATDENGVKIDRSTDGSYYAPDQRASLAADATSFTESGLVQAMLYRYRVTSFNVKGFAASAEIVVTTPGTPLAPTNCRTTVLSPTSIRVRWNNNSNTQTALYVERSTNSAFTSPTVLTIAGNTTVVDITGLNNNTTYYVRVRSQNAGGYSPYSNTATATTFRR